MATSFKRLYLCLPKQSRPAHVQVQDAEQAEIKLPLDEYEARGGQPAWQSLPWQGEDGLATNPEGKKIPVGSM